VAHPRAIGRYEVLGELATGGMAEIFLGRILGPSGFERPVVIKRILRQLARKESFVAMFLDEARIVAGIRHPNVVQVQELGQEGGELYLVMEYLEGESVASLIRRLVSQGERIDYGLAAHVVAAACAGLHAAHEAQNLVHRDVSPQNVFITYDGHVKIIDFGIAKTADRMARTEAGQVKGKFGYMSPEQCRGEALDRRTDVFALGIVLYELSTLRRLYAGTSELKIMQAICEEPLVPPGRVVMDYPKALERALVRALAKARSERYATALEMRRDLLEVERTMTEAPEEALAALMRNIFPDRIAEKQEMLQRVRSGAALTHVPSNDPDENVEVPAARSVAIVQGVPAPFGWLRLLVATIFLAGAAAVLYLFFLRPQVSVPPPLVVASAPPVAGASASATPDDAVVVRVETNPAGARVLVQGSERGMTPIELKLDRDAGPVGIELLKGGFLPLTQTVVPDADQRLLLSLQPATLAAPPPSAPSPVVTRGKKASKPPTSVPARAAESVDPPGFHRFD
jgi:serine/threonine-protein kinase